MAAKHDAVTLTFDSADDPVSVQAMFDAAMTAVFSKPALSSVIDMEIEPEAVQHDSSPKPSGWRWAVRSRERGRAVR